jgi:hypothetical protein
MLRNGYSITRWSITCALLAVAGCSVQSPRPIVHESLSPIAGQQQPTQNNQPETVDIPIIVRRAMVSLQQEYLYAPKEVIERVTEHEIQKWQNMQGAVDYAGLYEQIRSSIYKNFLQIIQGEMHIERYTIEFKGRKLGSDINEISSRSHAYRCSGYNVIHSTIGDKHCIPYYRESIANAPVTSITYIYFYNKLHDIQINFDESNFSMVVAAFAEKYGPGERGTEILQNRMGASFENITYIWKIGDVFIQAKRYAGTITESNIMYGTNYSLREIEKRMTQQKKKSARDL